MPYIGRDAQTAQSQNKIIDDISSSFNGSTTSFALLVGGVAPAPFPVTSQNLLISVGGVIQEPDGTGTNGYQLTGANIVFSAAPASGQSFFGVILAGADYVNAGANFPDGDAGTPSITFSQDLDTGLFRSGTGTTSFTSNNNRIADFGTTEIVFNEDGDDINFRVEGDTDDNLLFVDAGNDSVGIRTSQPAAFDSTASDLVVGDEGSGDRGITIASGNSSRGTLMFADGTTGSSEFKGYLQYNHNGDYLAIATNNSEAIRIDSSQRTGFRTSSPIATVTALGISANSEGGTMCIQNTAAGAGTHVSLYLTPNNGGGNDLQRSAAIKSRQEISGNFADLEFYTSHSNTPTERMRISSDGIIRIGQNTSNDPSGSNIIGVAIGTDYISTAGNNGNAAVFGRMNSDGSCVLFRRQTSNVGSISVNGSSTAYNTSSDHRLKENVVDLEGAITRVKQLAPKRFNFIVDAETTVDGFLAHEAQAVVPEAITGTHNEIDENGDPVYQGIDQSKLVPLLTAALQEAIAKIEMLETKVTTLEGAS